MKSAVVVLGILFAAGQELSAQALGGLFDQNQTQLKYLAAQILALDGYSSLLETGYGITGSGLDSISGLEQSDEDQHAGYFASLDAVSPSVANDPRVSGIREYNGAVATVADAMAGLGTALAGTVAANLKTAAGQDLAALQELLTDGSLQLEDAERLRLIGSLDLNARSRFAFAVDAFGKMQGIK